MCSQWVLLAKRNTGNLEALMAMVPFFGSQRNPESGFLPIRRDSPSTLYSVGIKWWA